MALLASCAPSQIDVRSVVAIDRQALHLGSPFYEDGKKQLEAGQPMLALKSFQRADLAEPRSLLVLNALGATYDDIGQFALAERYYREALALAPTDAQTLNNFGYSLMLQGKPEEAAVYLEQARKSSPADAVIAANIEQARAQEPKAEIAAGATPEPAAGAAAESERKPAALIERVTEFVQALSIESVRHALAAPEEQDASLTSVTLPLPPVDAGAADAPPAVQEIASDAPSAAVMTLRDLKQAPVSSPVAAAEPVQPLPVVAMAVAAAPREVIAAPLAAAPAVAEPVRPTVVATAAPAAPREVTLASVSPPPAAVVEPVRPIPVVDMAVASAPREVIAAPLAPPPAAVEPVRPAAAVAIAAPLAPPAAVVEPVRPAAVVAMAAPALRHDLGPVRPPARVDIANGAGRSGMAVRMRSYLRSHHVAVGRALNDRSFRHATSVVFYGKGSLGAARHLASFLPIEVALRSDPGLDGDVRLRLGADLLRFDNRLRSRGQHNAI